MRFTLRQLQVFVAVARQESVSKAAVLLSLSQSAASTSITELELNGKSGFGSLAVGATLTIGNYLATLLIGGYMQRHPESQVKLHVQNT
ncbi:Transcriptional regulator, LysR family, partial [Pseudomonas syringae pv. maculicola]